MRKDTVTESETSVWPTKQRMLTWHFGATKAQVARLELRLKWHTLCGTLTSVSILIGKRAEDDFGHPKLTPV